jgi:hypothetical protein
MPSAVSSSMRSERHPPRFGPVKCDDNRFPASKPLVASLSIHAAQPLDDGIRQRDGIHDETINIESLVIESRS